MFLRSLVSTFVLSAVLFFSTLSFAAQSYKLDGVHSAINFAVAHLMVSKTDGNFGDFQTDIAFSPDDLAGSRFDFVINAKSINTRNEKRDEHLKSADFLDAEQFPQIIFKTKSIVSTGGQMYDVTGDLQIKDVVKEVTIPVKVLGPVQNPFGQGSILGLEASFIIDRQQYNVSFNKVLDNGGLVVGNEVEVRVNIEAHSN